MELLITGFVLIGLLQLPEAMEDWGLQYLLGRSNANIFIFFLEVFINGLITGVRIITVNLVILLLMRGFWVGMIGLSSAYPKGIQPDKLNFADRFARNLQRESLDAEGLIVRLDNWCSSIFALSFLFLFAAISLGVFLLQIGLLGRLHDEVDFYTPVGSIPEFLWSGLIFTIMGIYLLGALLKVVDYATAGGLKRIKNRYWVAIYYRWSQFVSFTSLGFLYRSIYYIFASNINRRSITVVFLVYLAALVIQFLGIDFRTEHLYYPAMWRNQYELSYGEYENLREEQREIVAQDMIQSDVIKDDYIKLFLFYDIYENSVLEERCPDLNPLVQDVSAALDINVNNESIFDNRELLKEDVAKALDCFSSYYKIMVNDSVYTDLTYIFHRHRFHDEPGLLTYFSVAHLPTGFHKIAIYRGDAENPNWIQFWKQ